MNTVEPIRDISKIEDIKKYLRGKNLRDYALFIVGINVALRIGDLLQLTWEQVLSNQEKIKFRESVTIREQKTRKMKRFPLNKSVQKALTEYANSLDREILEGFIFESRQGQGNPISRQMASVIITEVAEKFGLENINTHSLRKTFGYHAWINGVHPSLIMEAFNHSNLYMTRKYLGIIQAQVDEVYQNLNL